jgi:hypothetical protein
MKIKDKYLNIIKECKDLEFDPFKHIKKNILYVNDEYKKILLDDLIKVDINSLYPNILIGLFNVGLIDKKWEKDINKTEWFLKNRSKLKLGNNSDYLKYKIHTNSLYNKIGTPLVVEYLHLFYSDLIEKYKNDIIYIDVDLIILKDGVNIDRDLNLMNFNFSKSKVDNFYFTGKKRYVIYSEGLLEHRGFTINKKDLLQDIKSEIRNKRLNKILIFTN